MKKDISKLKQGDKIVIIKDGEYSFKYTVGQVYKFVKEQDGYIKVSVDGLMGEWAHTTLLGDHEWDFYVEPETSIPHQWKLDDVVMIASSSEYYRNDDSLNPRDISGTIYHINDDDDHNIKVKWSNGKTNSYRPKDLVEFMEQTIVGYDRFNVGDKLPQDIVNDWTNSGCNEYTESRKEWRKSVSRYHYDISISSIVRHQDGEIAFGLGDNNFYIRAKGFRDFMNEKTTDVPVVVPGCPPYIPIHTSYQGWNVGDQLLESQLTSWIKAGENYWNSSARWQRDVFTTFFGDRKIEKIEDKDGVTAFLVSGTMNIWIRADGYSQDSQFIAPPIPTAYSPYVIGEWIEFDNNIIRVKRLSPTHIAGKPWILRGELMLDSGTWDLDSSIFLNAIKIDISDERIQKALPGDSIYKKTYYPPPPVAPASSRFVVGQIIIATRDTPWWKKGNIGRINSIRDWNVFTLSIYKDGEFDGSNWTAVNDQFTEYNGNIHIRPGTASEVFNVYTSENWSTLVDKSAVKIVKLELQSLEFQSPVLLKKKTKKSKLVIINN